MLQIFICLAGIFTILVISEVLGQKKNLRGDPQRKIVHMAAGAFIAFWPWLISWRAIQLIGIAMLAVVLLNHRYKLVDFHSKIRRHTYGDIFYAMSVILLPVFSHQKVFFAVAMLIMSIGDGLASLVGRKYGKNRRYKIFNHNKTLIGSMTLWLVSLCILAVGLLFAHNIIDFHAYSAMIIFLPPILVITENASVIGLDNFAIPFLVLLSLNLVK